MSRRARIVVPGVAHHVTQRGNYQQPVFEKEMDFRKYLYWLADYAKEYHVKIHAYCLMSNHVHFIVTPTNQLGLARLFNTLHMCYAQYKNAEKKSPGHLWQGRFYSCLLSPEHLLRAIRYVEMNPVRAKIVAQPWDYPWSSARQHLSLDRRPIVKTEFHQNCTEAGLHAGNWKEYLFQQDVEMTEDMRNKTQKGLAVGTLDFIMKLEHKFGIILQERKAGRPKNVGKNGK